MNDSAPLSAPKQWQQIALQLEALGPISTIAALAPDLSAQSIQEDLLAAQQARDMFSQREVLERVYVHLAERAAARGRRPVPKSKL